VRARGRNIADIIRRNGQTRLAFMALERNGPDLLQTDNDFSFECHAGEVYHGMTGSLKLTSWARAIPVEQHYAD
jgi:hypothetical protein